MGKNHAHSALTGHGQKVWRPAAIRSLTTFFPVCGRCLVSPSTPRVSSSPVVGASTSDLPHRFHKSCTDLPHRPRVGYWLYSAGSTVMSRLCLQDTWGQRRPQCRGNVAFSRSSVALSFSLSLSLSLALLLSRYCVHEHMYIHVYTLYVYKHTYICTHLYMYTNVCINICACVSTYAQVGVHVHMCTSAYV